MQKILLSFAASMLLTLACNQKSDQENAENTDTVSTEVDASSDSIFHGTAFNADEFQQPMEVLTDLQPNDSVAATLKGTVKEVCQSKGCWMTIELANGESMRVTFKDYGFFVPKDLAGNEVVITGLAKNEETDVATLQHFAEDAGKSEEEIAAITAPKMDYKFIATGVKIIK